MDKMLILNVVEGDMHKLRSFNSSSGCQVTQLNHRYAAEFDWLKPAAGSVSGKNVNSASQFHL
jgi:hypothetical protein